VVAAAGPVVLPALGDIVDGAIDGEEDGLFRVGPVEGAKVFVGVFSRAALGIGLDWDPIFHRHDREAVEER
jgi:hypothetical protein